MTMTIFCQKWGKNVPHSNPFLDSFPAPIGMAAAAAAMIFLIFDLFNLPDILTKVDPTLAETGIPGISKVCNFTFPY